MYTTLIPPALLGPAAPKSQSERPEASPYEDYIDRLEHGEYWITPDVTSSRGARTQSAAWAEGHLRKDIAECFHPELYVFDTSPEVHRSAVEIAVSEEVSKLFRELNDTIEEPEYRGRRTVKVSMSTKICELSESVRKQLNAENAPCGKLVPKGKSASVSQYNTTLYAGH
jgi:hypothetical protein